MRYLLILLIFISCGTSQVVSSEDITHKAKWLESNPDNPIINIIQKTYENDNVEIIIKKKLTTDYVKIRLSSQGKHISKKTVKNEKAI